MNEIKPRTRESIEYDKALKTLHELSLKKALSEEGVNTSKVPRQKFDDIRRLVDKQPPLRQKYQEIITKAQQEMQAELAEIQKEVEDIIKSIKIEQGIIIPVPEVPQMAPETELKKESVEEEVKKEPEAGESQEDEK